MKNILVFFLVSYLVVFSIFGQENALYYDILQAKSSNIYFENVVLKETKADVKALENFINPDEVSFFENISLNLKNSQTKALNLVLPIRNKNMVLELVEVPESFYNYEVVTSDGKKFPANRNIIIPCMWTTS